MAIQGMIFGAIIWIMVNVLMVLIIMQSVINAFGAMYYLTTISFGFIVYLVFGCIIGILYNKWSVKDQPITDAEFNSDSSKEL